MLHARAAAPSSTAPTHEGTSDAGASPSTSSVARESGAGDAPYRTVVRADAEGPLSRQRDVDARTPGFATVVDLDEEPGARPADAMSEVIARTPGATVRSIGGLGQFSAVSLRGSAPQQVGVFLDGVPLGSAMAGLVDLSELPLDGLDRVVIHRGHVPVAYGGATLGGAIDFQSAPGTPEPRMRMDAGYGSLGARQGRAALTLPLRRRLQLTTRVGYGGADGDFPYYDTAGTPTFTGDDSTTIRKNNHYDRVLGQVRLDGRRGPWRFGIQELALWKRQGIAGRDAAQAQATSLDSAIVRTIASAEHTRFGRPGGRLRWVAGLGVQTRRFRDPLGEVGLVVDDERTTGIDLYLSPRLRVPLWRGAFLGIVADARSEWVGVREAVPPGPTSGDADRFRLGWGFGAELEQFLFDRRLMVVPVVRVDAIDSRFAVPPGEGEQDDEGTDHVDVGLAPRLGARLTLVPGLQLRGSAGRYFRPPTLMELFGDRGYIVGNEGLAPERGTAVDGGVLVDIDRRDLDLHAQVAGFWTRSEDLIQWIAAGPVVRPENVSAARMRGLEASLEIVPGGRQLLLTLTYTLLDSEDLSEIAERRGRPLPGRPRHDLFGRASVGHEWWVRGVPVEPRILYTAELVAGTYLDPSGRVELPPRALQGLGAELHIGRRISLAVEVRNLLDVRTASVRVPIAGSPRLPLPISDYLGFPLPGRTVWASIEVDMHLPEPRHRRRPSK